METPGGIGEGVDEVIELVDEDQTAAVQITSAGKALAEEKISERRGPIEPSASEESKKEAKKAAKTEVEEHGEGCRARVGVEEGTAVSDEELTELSLRAPAGFTTDELRYMLAQSVADCAAALPEISAAMVQVAAESEDFEKLAFLGEFVAAKVEDAAAREGAPDPAPAAPAPLLDQMEEKSAAGAVRASQARAGETGTAESAMDTDEVDDEALLALDIDQARADAAAAAAAAAASSAASASAASEAMPPPQLPPQMMSREERSRLQQEGEQELKQLRRAHVQQKRDADTVTDEMYMQCKQLLRLLSVLKVPSW